MIILSMICASSYAQNQNTTQELIHKDNNTNKPVGKIVFKDKNGAKIREFDIEDNNPFKNKGLSMSNDNSQARLAGNKKVKDLVNNSQHYKNQDAANTDANYVHLQSGMIQNESKEVRGVVYRLSVSNAGHEQRGTQAEIVVFDKEGNIEKTLSPETSYYEPVLTDDGKFLAFIYGGVVDHNGYQIFDDSFCIYDMRNGDRILNLPAEHGYSTSAPIIWKDFIVLILIGNNFKYFIVDPKNRTYFTNEYSNLEAGKLKDLDATGFTFNFNGVDRVDLYKDKFTQHTF